MYRLLFSASFVGCFKHSELLNLRWGGVTLKDVNGIQCVSIRLRWHKKAHVGEESQIYNIPDEKCYTYLKVRGFYTDYLEEIKKWPPRCDSCHFVFPNARCHSNGLLVLDWNRGVDQRQVLNALKITVEETPGLPLGITLHSTRRGGSYYRVFESLDRKFTFRN
ncbi:hypothetical protein THRCLA_21551 [Thraustotheca clavata]|uniref:Uncharacterized protein n=1 Tax=Thraustotheca clavata TaxID=74557 RepID=A0A1V9ZVA9_9STRA|nr:hypothetical protein THRCLA_21551 [Thraustotheca clavata]